MFYCVVLQHSLIKYQGEICKRGKGKTHEHTLSLRTCTFCRCGNLGIGFVWVDCFVAGTLLMDCFVGEDLLAMTDILCGCLWIVLSLGPTDESGWSSSQWRRKKIVGGIYFFCVDVEKIFVGSWDECGSVCWILCFDMICWGYTAVIWSQWGECQRCAGSQGWRKCGWKIDRWDQRYCQLCVVIVGIGDFDFVDLWMSIDVVECDWWWMIQEMIHYFEKCIDRACLHCFFVVDGIVYLFYLEWGDEIK